MQPEFGAPAHRSSVARRGLVVLVVALVAAACGSGGGSGDSGRDRTAGPGTTVAARGDGCDPDATPVEPQGPSAETVTLQEGGGGQPAVEAVVYPRPDYQGDPWTQWGQGLVLPDGRFLAAIGDHLGRDGNSYLYVYNPERGRITRFTDVLSQVEHENGEWGYG